MTERQLVSLESKFADGNYYDLLQSYKALYFRFTNQKKSKEVIALLMSGASNFLKYEQYDCASELAKLLIEAYNNFSIQYSPETKSNILKLYKDYKDNNSHGKVLFLRAAIKWSSGGDENNKGSPEFHKLLGDTLAGAGDYIDAQKHYLFSDDPLALSSMLKKWIKEADNENKEETDLYIARAVLGYLCIKRLDYANSVYKGFISSLSEDDTNTPLLNYLKFLLLTLQRDALPLFNTLRQRYSTSLQRDPKFSKYLDQIANVFYNVPLQSSSGGFGSILSNLFGSLSSPPATNSPQPTTTTTHQHLDNMDTD